MPETIFDKLKKDLESQGISWSDDKIRKYIKDTISAQEEDVSTPTAPPVEEVVEEAPPAEEITQGGGYAVGRGAAPTQEIAPQPAAQDQNAVMDFLGNTLWGATEGASWGLATGADIATGGKVAEKVSLGYSDKWDEESFAGKAGYILGSGVGALTGFILSGGTLAAAGGATRLGATAISKAGGLALKTSSKQLATKIGAKETYNALTNKALTGGVKKKSAEFFEQASKAAADKHVKISRGWWWNKGLKKEAEGFGKSAFWGGKTTRQIGRQELYKEAENNLTKTLTKQIKNITGLKDEVLAREISQEAFKLAQTYNSKNLNTALSSIAGNLAGKMSKKLGGQTWSGEISKKAQLLAAGIAEAAVFATHTVGDHLHRNLAFNVLADETRLVNGIGEDLTAEEVWTGMMWSIGTGAALGPFRYIKGGKVTGRGSVDRYRTWEGKKIDGLSTTAPMKLGILSKDLPGFFSAIKKRVFPRRYKIENATQQEAVITKANILMTTSDGGLKSFLPSGLASSDLAMLPRGAEALKSTAKKAVKFLKNVEKEYSSGTAVWLSGEMARDIFTSIPRMAVGTTIMNLHAFKENKEHFGTIWGADPKETAAHILTGMFFTKKKHTFLGGENTTFFDMNRFRKYSEGLEILGYDTREINALKAFMGDRNESARKVLIEGHEGVNAADDVMRDESTRTVFLSKEQRIQKDVKAAEDGTRLRLFQDHVAGDSNLNELERKEIKFVYSKLKDALNTSLYSEKSVGTISDAEYATIKSKLLSENFKINGQKVNVNNVEKLVSNAITESIINTNERYAKPMNNFIDNLAEALGAKRETGAHGVIDLDAGVKVALESLKVTKEGDEFYQKRMKRIAAEVLDALKMNELQGNIKYIPEVQGYAPPSDLATGQRVEKLWTDALEELHQLQFGDGKKENWRITSFGGTLKDKDATAERLEDRFVDLTMLSSYPIHAAIRQSRLHHRTKVVENIFNMDVKDDRQISPENRLELSNIHESIKMKFKDGGRVVVGDGDEITSINIKLKNMYDLYRIEHTNTQAREVEIERGEAERFISDAEQYAGDLFSNELSYRPFKNYMEWTFVDRLLDLQPETKRSFLEYLNSDMSQLVGIGHEITIPRVADVQRALGEKTDIDKEVKESLVKYYEVFSNQIREAGGRIKQSEVQQNIQPEVVFETVNRMQQVSDHKRWVGHLHTAEEFRQIAKGTGEIIKEISNAILKKTNEAKTGIKEGLKDQGVEVEADKRLQAIEAFETQEKIVTKLLNSQNSLFEQYERALAGHDWIVLNSLLQNDIVPTFKEIYRDLEKSLEDPNFNLKTVSEKYALLIDKMTLDAIGERNKALRTGSLSEIMDSTSDIPTFLNVKSRKTAINLNKFATRHGISMDTINEYFSISRSYADELKAFIKNTKFVREVSELTEELFPGIDNAGKAISAKKTYISLKDIENKMSAKKFTNFLPVFAKSITERVLRDNSIANEKQRALGKEELRSEDRSKILDEVLILLRNELDSIHIPTVQWENGKMIENIGKYGEWNHGWGGLYKDLELLETQSVYLFVEKAIDNKVLSLHNESTLRAIENKMQAGEVEIENISERTRIHSRGDIDAADVQGAQIKAGWGRGGRPKLFAMTLDGKTILAIQPGADLHNKIINKYEQGGDVRKRLEAILKDRNGKINKRAQVILDEIDSGLNSLRHPDSETSNPDFIRKIFYVTRLLRDQPMAAREELLSGEVGIDSLKILKYLKSLAPKGKSVTEKALEGARAHIGSMKKRYAENNRAGDAQSLGTFTDLEARMNRATKDRQGKDRPANFVPIIDETLWDGSKSESTNFFDVYNKAKAAEKNQHYFDENGKFKEELWDEEHKELKKASKSSVDSEMLVTLDMMSTLLFAKGEIVADTFHTNSKTGAITGVRSGALKPNIWHTEINEKTGAITVFTEKTAIKWDPEFESVLKEKNADGLVFKTGNKMNEKIDKFGDKKRHQAVDLRMDELVDSSEYRNGEWKAPLIRRMREVLQSDGSDGVKIPFEDILLRGVGRESDAALTRAMFTYLDEASLSALNKWIGQPHNLEAARKMLTMTKNITGFTQLARAIAEKKYKTEGEVENELFDTIVKNGFDLPVAFAATLDQKVMRALERSGNFTGEAKEGSYPVMTAGNGLTEAVRRGAHPNKEQSGYGGSGMSYYASNKEVHFAQKGSSKKLTAHPSLIVSIGGENFIIGKEADRIEILSRGRLVGEGEDPRAIKFANIILAQMGIKKSLRFRDKDYDLVTKKHEEAIFEIVDTMLKDTYKSMSELKGRSVRTVHSIAAWLDGRSPDTVKTVTSSTKDNGGKNYRIKNDKKSQSYRRDQEMQKKIDKVIKDIIKHRKSLVKGDKQLADELENFNSLKALTKKKLIDGFWLAEFNSRIPNDSIENMVITRVEKLLNKLRGSVGEINSGDATLVQDADYDFDESVAWWGMPWPMVKNFAEVSGFAHFSTGKRFPTEARTVPSLTSNVDKELREIIGQDAEYGRMRAALMSSHHLLSFIKNIENEQNMTKRYHDGLVVGAEPGFIPKETYRDKIEIVKDLHIEAPMGSFDYNNESYQIKISANADFIKTVHNIKDWIKQVMDIDSASRSSLKRMTLEDINNEIFFGKENGLFRVFHVHKQTGKLNKFDWTSLGNQNEIKKDVMSKLVWPVRKLFSLMGNEYTVRDDSGSSLGNREVMAYDKARLIGEMRRDLEEIMQGPMPPKGGLNFKNGAEFIHAALNESEHPYLKNLREFSDHFENDWISRSHPVSELLFMRTQKMLKENYESLSFVASKYVNNQKLAVDVFALDKVIESIEKSMDFFASQTKENLETSSNPYAQSWRNHKEDLAVKQKLRETLTAALSYDVAMSEGGIKNVMKGSYFLGDTGEPATIMNNNKTPMLIYRSEVATGKKQKFEIVQPEQESNMIVKKSDNIVINPRRFEFIDNVKQQGLQSQFTAFATPPGINNESVKIVEFRRISDLVRETIDYVRDTFYDDNGNVHMKQKSGTDWKRYEIKIYEVLEKQFEKLQKDVGDRGQDATEIRQRQFIYEMLRPDPNTKVTVLSHVVDGENNLGSRYSGPKYFDNSVAVKTMLGYLQKVANKSKHSMALTPEAADKHFKEVMEIYTNHVRNQWDPFLPQNVVNIVPPTNFGKRKRSSYLPDLEAPEHMKTGEFNANKEAGVLADWVLGFKILPVNMVYDLSINLGSKLADRVDGGSVHIEEMARSGRLGEMIANVWKQRGIARDQHGRRVEVDDPRRVIEYVRDAKMNRIRLGTKQEKLSSEFLKEIFENDCG